MASSMVERPGLRSENHQRDHLQSFIANKQAYLDAKAAQQRAEHAAQICKAAPSPKPIPIKEVCALNGTFAHVCIRKSGDCSVYRLYLEIFGVYRLR